MIYANYFSMKKHLYLLLICLTLLPNIIMAEATATNAPVAYVIPIKGVIERALLYVVRRGIDEAVKENAKAIIFDMDTPGGRVDVTEDIIRIMIDLPENIETYTFIDKDALSAGSMIAISTKHIYMSPGSRIGASAIVTSTGDIKEGDLKEKHVSALTALIRSAAERSGHDPDLIESMIRKDIEYKIGDEIICKEGQLLTLNDTEAFHTVKRKETEEPLLSAGTAKTLKDMMELAGLKDATVRKIEITRAERIARFIELFSFVFLAGGLLGIYVEFKTPGFGIPGLAGITLLAIFFWGHHIVGVSGSLEMIIFAIGLILLALEIFVIPGFGIAGTAGLALIIISLFMAMVEHYPGTKWFQPPVLQFEDAFKHLGLGLSMSLILGLIVARFLPKTNGFQHLMLSNKLESAHGVTASSSTDDLLGAKGKSVTPLHPAGFATINGKRINVVAHGAFIDANTAIVVAETHGSRIVVDIDHLLTETNKTGSTT
jgi:membrane-bound serine protease (ClpP class)